MNDIREVSTVDIVNRVSIRELVYEGAVCYDWADQHWRQSEDYFATIEDAVRDAREALS